ncbi:MAG: hypothetical protein NUV81_01060 [bacterium]|nr:hypothetical protein [bacterium]
MLKGDTALHYAFTGLCEGEARTVFCPTDAWIEIVPDLSGLSGLVRMRFVRSATITLNTEALKDDVARIHEKEVAYLARVDMEFVLKSDQLVMCSLDVIRKVLEASRDLGLTAPAREVATAISTRKDFGGSCYLSKDIRKVAEDFLKKTDGTGRSEKREKKTKAGK